MKFEIPKKIIKVMEKDNYETRFILEGFLSVSGKVRYEATIYHEYEESPGKPALISTSGSRSNDPGKALSNAWRGVLDIKKTHADDVEKGKYSSRGSQ